jgi:acyl carrier protein
MDKALVTPEAVVGRVFGLNPADIDDTTSPDTVAVWDSLGHITLVIELETAYGVSFSPEEALSLMSVGKIKSVLTERGVTW